MYFSFSLVLTTGGGGVTEISEVTDLVYFSSRADGGGGGVVTEISEAHRPSVLFPPNFGKLPPNFNKLPPQLCVKIG